MGIFDIFKKKNKDVDRLKEIFTIKDRLLKEKINISKKLYEGNFYNRDSTHLSLLDKLKEVDDEIQKLISEEDSIMKNSTSDIIQTIKNTLELIPGEDDKPVPPEVWEIYQRKGNRDYSSNELIEDGKEAYEAENFGHAIKCFKKALTINPNDPDTLISLGIAYIDNNNPHNAISSFKKATDIRPNHAETHFLLAGAYNEIEKYDEEIDCYNKTIKLNPNHADAYFCLGNAYGLKGQGLESIPYYEKYLKIDPFGDYKEFALDIIKKLKPKD